MLKKMTLLAGMALAAIAFAVPASASALEWTDNGAAFTGTASDTLSGFVSFGNPEPGQTKFGCSATAGVSATGGSASGSVTSFTPATSECLGEGTFEGCELVEDSTTGLPAGISIVGTNTLTMSNASIVIHNHYDANCPITKVTLTVSHLTFTLTNSNLTDVTVEGEALAHITLHSGFEFTETVGVFGTVGTASNTLSVS